MNRQTLKQIVDEKADAIDKLSTTLRTIGYDVGVAVQEYHISRGIDHLDYAAKLVSDLDKLVQSVKSTMVNYHKELKPIL